MASSEKKRARDQNAAARRARVVERRTEKSADQVREPEQTPKEARPADSDAQR